MLKCKINGKEIEVEKGTSLIEAFKKAGEDIAHYCWHPGLPIAGCCRLCMVEVEGSPRMQIACNTTVTEGMFATNTTDKVKETVRWGLDFHLINHPLDCPICDQAGECGLQDQYMKFGKYTPEMSVHKVKKSKCQSIGERVVLDSERCILCSRCVRFTSEISKTNELGIFHRGDCAEIGTFENRPLDNNYSLNTVDICPVGALTSKDFRFRQRVWYLKNGKSVCNGCSTGCNIKIYYNEEGLFRVRPEYNSEVNGYWMCDQGRDIYKFVNKDARLVGAKVGQMGHWEQKKTIEALVEVGDLVRAAEGNKVALALTGQYTQEEYQEMIGFMLDDLASCEIYHWINNPDQMDEFDGLLFRGDRNPNTRGLLDIFAKEKITGSWDSFESQLGEGKYEVVIVAGPENPLVFPDLQEKIQLFSRAKYVVWLSSAQIEVVDQITTKCWQIPMKSFFEKDGTFVNATGLKQQIKKIAVLVPKAVTLAEVAQALSGKDLKTVGSGKTDLKWKKTNFFVQQKGRL